MTSARAIGLQVHKVSAGQEIVRCPWHRDTNPSAWWSPRKNLFFCPVCNLGLNLMQVMQRLGKDALEVQEIEEEHEPEDYTLMNEPNNFEIGKFSVYEPYFKERRISPSVIFRYGVRWLEDTAVLPLTNAQWEVVGVVYRYTKPEKTGTRYKVLGKPPPVWPMHRLPGHQEGELLIITEGAWSAMRVETVRRQGPGSLTPISYSLLGAKANKKIVQALQPFNPVFLYDNDRAGRNACKKMRSLAPLWHSYVVNALDEQDDEQIVHTLDCISERVNVEWRPS